MSRSGTRSVSTRSRLVSIGCRRIVASTIVPVRPMPPHVAQKASASSSGVSVLRVPSGRASTSDSTWAPKLPVA